MKLPSKSVNPNEPSLNSDIISNTILIVEGKDEVYFFEELFKAMQIAKDIQIIDIGGVENIKNKIKVIKNMPNFDQVVSIGIIRDGDDSIDSAVQSLQDILRNVELPVPNSHNSFSNETSSLKVGIFVMPGNEIEGRMLEDLCLQTKSDDFNIELINKYLEELKEKGTSYPSNIAKAKCLIYLASMNKVVNNIGLGAKKGYWNFESESLNSLKNFVENL